MLTMLLPKLSFSQSYIPMLGETNEWRAVSCFGGCITDTYFALGDTLVDGNLYKVLDGYHYIQGNFLIREDTQERTVYMKLLGSHTVLDEYPLYDFSVSVDDTINVYNPISPLPEYGGEFVVDSIVPRTLENGDHRFFYLHAVSSSVSGSEKTVWVEGVGALSLINSPGAPPTEEGHIGCAFKDGILMYARTDSIGSCGALSVSNPDKAESFMVYPNPSSEFVNLRYNGTTNPESILVFSSEGRLVLTTSWRTRLNVSELDTGFYLVELLFEDGTQRQARLLVQ